MGAEMITHWLVFVAGFLFGVFWAACPRMEDEG